MKFFINEFDLKQNYEIIEMLQFFLFIFIFLLVGG